VSIEFAPKIKEVRAIFVVIPLLILHLALLSLQVQDTAGTILLNKWMLAAEMPIVSGSSQMANGVAGAWRGYVWFRGMRAENEQLQKSLQQLALQNNALRQMKEENSRLRSLVAINDIVPFQALGARVVGRTPGYLSNIIYIDRGSTDGLALDAPVISGNGVIGRIINVFQHQSQVQLITNPDASTGVMIETTHSPGVLRGSGNFALELDYISNTEQINVGDVVVTSGLDRIYPKGLPIGKVIDSRKSNSVFRAIKVEPSTDLVRLEEVSVLTSRPKPESSPIPGGAVH
jgi:rod shape-determining protein MreC